MAKKFAEHNGLNLTQVNNDILEMWREKTSRVLLQQMDTQESTTFWLVPSRIPSTVIRP